MTKQSLPDVFQQLQDRPLTDTGNAQRLAELAAGTLCYVGALGWMTWDGARWLRDDAARVERQVIKMVRLITTEAGWEGDPDEKLAGAIHKWAVRSDSARGLDATLRVARSHPKLRVPVEEFDARLEELNFPNGTANLATGAIGPNDRAARHTRVTGAHYDKKATCPRWEAFLEYVLPDPEVRSFMQRATGYSATGSIDEHALMFLYGDGNNGKSVFLETIAAVLGDYALEAPPGLLTTSRSPGATEYAAEAALRGRRLVITDELEQGAALAEATVKRLTSAATINAKFMRHDFFEFKNVSKVWVASNHQPTIKGTDGAIWRRVYVVPFTVVIPKDREIRGFGDTLREEYPGILKWILDGVAAWHAEGLAAPDAVRVATDDYREESHPLAEWFEECTLNPEGRTSRTALYASFDRRYNPGRIGRRAFYGYLRSAGFTSEPIVNGEHFFDGIIPPLDMEPSI